MTTNNLKKIIYKLIAESFRKYRLKTMLKQCSLAGRKQCQVNESVKHTTIHLYLYFKLIFVYEKNGSP